MKAAVLIPWLLLCGPAFAQAPSPATSREIGGLFAALEGSGCEFYRNGSWYGARKASDHLQRKYDYLLKKRLVASAESFIDLAASESSLSGKPYLVRCGNAAPVPSKAWFTGKLRELRKSPVGTGKSDKAPPARSQPAHGP